MKLIDEVFDERSVALIRYHYATWAHETNLPGVQTYLGAFLVKTAYVLALKLAGFQTEQECSTASTARTLWRKIWRLKVKSKIKHFFIRRACNYAFPTRIKLYNRRILGDPTCLFCKRKEGECGNALLPETLGLWYRGRYKTV